MSAYQVFIIQIVAAGTKIGLAFVQDSGMRIVADSAVFVDSRRMDHLGLESFLNIAVAVKAEGGLFGGQKSLTLLKMRDVADQTVVILEDGVFFLSGQLCRQVFVAS